MTGGTRGARVNAPGLGRDGKSYPATPLTRQQRARAIYLAHALVHRGGHEHPLGAEPVTP